MLHSTGTLQVVLQFAFKRIKRICFFYNRRKLVPTFSATIRYRFLSFASGHSGDVKIVCCILQVNINTSVSIYCEQIRKVARCKTSNCFMRHRNCFTFNHFGDCKLFKVLDQKGSRCIVAAIGDHPCSLILQVLQRPQSSFTTASSD